MEPLQPVNLRQRLQRLSLVVFDFDGVFTDNRVWISEKGEETVCCNRGDGLGLQRLRKVRLPCFILSTEINPVVGMRARKLGIEFFQGVVDKSSHLKKVIDHRGVNPEDAAYIGNDINDLDCLKWVGLPVVVADAWPEVLPFAQWVLQRRGGEGAVREFCDAAWNARGGTP